VAVEVFGFEYGYTAIARGTGVFCNPPGGCAGHRFRTAMLMGNVDAAESAFNTTMDKLREEWQGASFDENTHGSAQFAECMLARLGIDCSDDVKQLLGGDTATAQPRRLQKSRSGVGLPPAENYRRRTQSVTANEDDDWQKEY